MHTIAKIAVILTAAATAFFFCRAIIPQSAPAPAVLLLQITVAAFLADRWERRINAAITANRERMQIAARQGHSLQIAPHVFTAALASLPADDAAQVRAMMKRGTWPN